MVHSDWMLHGQDFTEWGKGSLNLEKTSGGGGGVRNVFWNDTMVLKPWFLPTNVTPAKSFQHQ